MPRRFLERWQQDILSEPRLRGAGALLALGQLLCAFRLAQLRADRMLAVGGEPLCWPMWPGCAAARGLDQPVLAGLLVLLGLLALSSAIAFLRRSRLALPLLAATMLLLLAVEAQDLRLRLNQFYMLAIAVAAFTLLPSRDRALRTGPRRSNSATIACSRRS